VSKRTSFTVSEVAALAKISVRALHHYDEIGLLRPSGRSHAGYRLYSTKDLLRLQQVMSFKVLGFPLEEIRRLLADPGFDVREALTLQRQLLAEKAGQVQALIAAVDAALAGLDNRRKKMESDKLFRAFDGFDPKLYEEEARERWGHTDAYRESMQRTARYTTAEWTELKAEADSIYRALAQVMSAGTPATDASVMALAEKHRQHIERWFYPCSSELHRGLGELYVGDARFTKNIDRYGAGLAAFLRDAIVANCGRAAEGKRE
jgi:DNA-binding transcriptional MerR regulator